MTAPLNKPGRGWRRLLAGLAVACLLGLAFGLGRWGVPGGSAGQDEPQPRPEGGSSQALAQVQGPEAESKSKSSDALLLNEAFLAQAWEDAPRDNRPTRSHLPKDQTEQALEILERINPPLTERLRAWHRRDPERVARMIGRHLPKIRQLIRLQRTDPERYELMVQDMRLSQELKELVNRAINAERQGRERAFEQIKADLRQHVGEQFAVRQRLRQVELERLQKQLRRLKQQIDQQASAKERLIAKRIKRLLKGRKPQDPRAAPSRSDS